MTKIHYSHELSTTRMEQFVGAFVLIPLLVLGVVLFVIVRGESLFAMKYEIKTNLSQAYGIQSGTVVYVHGVFRASRNCLCQYLDRRYDFFELRCNQGHLGRALTRMGSLSPNFLLTMIVLGLG